MKDPGQLARARMRCKISLLEEAFVGHFTDHRGFLLRTMLARVDETSVDIAAVEARIEELITPFAQAVEKLDQIPGVGITAAHVILAEIGTDMTRFATAAHLCSWARFAPGVKESAGKNKGRGATGHGNPYLARVLGEAAVCAGRTDTFLGERYRRIARRRGKKKAIVAVGRSILVIVWHLLSDPDPRFHDLGPDFYDTHIGPERKRLVTTSVNSKPSATRSPWNPPPDPPHPDPGSVHPLRRAVGPARPSPADFGLAEKEPRRGAGDPWRSHAIGRRRGSGRRGRAGANRNNRRVLPSSSARSASAGSCRARVNRLRL
jgi:hypothetical protein